MRDSAFIGIALYTIFPLRCFGALYGVSVNIALKEQCWVALSGRKADYGSVLIKGNKSPWGLEPRVNAWDLLYRLRREEGTVLLVGARGIWVVFVFLGALFIQALK
ncbi:MULTISPECIES: hypothetical protein [unclassified Bartonella]|uniref:hypothetical protein n=1 Tax=unclassified Bartonella TaxID=2645622 RepID=UPI0035D063C2